MVPEARRREVFEGPLGHIVNVATAKWGMVPVFDTP